MRRDDLLERDLCYRIINAFYCVYKVPGFGFLEPIYSKALVIALRARGIRVDREVSIQILARKRLTPPPHDSANAPDSDA